MRNFHIHHSNWLQGIPDFLDVGWFANITRMEPAPFIFEALTVNGIVDNAPPFGRMTHIVLDQFVGGGLNARTLFG